VKGPPSRKGLRGFCLSVFLALGYFFFLNGCDQERAMRCAYDGFKIDPVYEVQFVMKDGESLRFCSIVCALEAFSQAKEGIESVLVTDEVTGQKLSADKAFFLESSVVDVPHVKNAIHVFASERDAVRHRDQYTGRPLSNPFILFNPWREEVVGHRTLRIKKDPVTGLTLIVKGSPYIMTLEGFDLENLDEAGAWRALKALLATLSNYLEVEPDELKFAGMDRVGGSWYISFWQTHQGVIIFESSIGFSIGPEGEIPSMGALLHKTHKGQDLPFRSKLTLKEAGAVAKAHLMKKEPSELTLVAYQLIIYPMKKREGVVDYYLAYILNYYFPEEVRVTRSRAGWVCFVDAITGQILEVRHLVAIASCCMPVDDET
jgi:hypothetical protein